MSIQFFIRTSSSPKVVIVTDNKNAGVRENLVLPTKDGIKCDSAVAKCWSVSVEEIARGIGEVAIEWREDKTDSEFNRFSYREYVWDGKVIEVPKKAPVK